MNQPELSNNQNDLSEEQYKAVSEKDRQNLADILTARYIHSHAMTLMELISESRRYGVEEYIDWEMLKKPKD